MDWQPWGQVPYFTRIIVAIKVTDQRLNHTYYDMFIDILDDDYTWANGTDSWPPDVCRADGAVWQLAPNPPEL